MRKIAFSLALSIFLAHSPVPAQRLAWSGFEWSVRSGTGGPGPNRWRAENVWLDAENRLHLKISHEIDGWSCAELYTGTRLAYGRYEFWTTGRLDLLDPRVVLGLFHYPTSDVGPDGTNEIDIEFARWGDPEAPNDNYTVWPRDLAAGPLTHSFDFPQTGPDTTHRYSWRPGRIFFQSLAGHVHANSAAASWLTPESFAAQVAAVPMPVHLNLWLLQGLPPLNGQEVELIVAGFRVFHYDVDGNGLLEAADVSLPAAYLAGNEPDLPGRTPSADADFDGVVTAVDLVLEVWGITP